VPPKRYPHTCKEVMASVLLPAGYETFPEPGGGTRYQNPDVAGSAELSIRRFMVGLAHTPSAQVAAELHLQSGDGNRKWVNESQPFEVDGAVATMREFTDIAAQIEGAVITAELGETMISARAIWPSGDTEGRGLMLLTLSDMRLLALEDLMVRRRSQLHPVFSISIERPEGWRISSMEETIWEFTLPGGSCSLSEVDTDTDLSGSSIEEVTALLAGSAPRQATCDEAKPRPTATRSPVYACTWTGENQTSKNQTGENTYGVVAVLLREIPILISATSNEIQQVDVMMNFVDSLRTHPALY
jgi:hypothetical protein